MGGCGFDCRKPGVGVPALNRPWIAAFLSSHCSGSGGKSLPAFATCKERNHPSNGTDSSLEEHNLPSMAGSRHGSASSVSVKVMEIAKSLIPIDCDHKSPSDRALPRSTFELFFHLEALFPVLRHCSWENPDVFEKPGPDSCKIQHQAISVPRGSCTSGSSNSVSPGAESRIQPVYRVKAHQQHNQQNSLRVAWLDG